MDESAIRKKLQAAGLRITYPRLALIAELSRSHTQPKSAAELSATLSQFPRSSVYRNLDALETAGLIRSSMVKWVRRYELGDLLAPHDAASEAGYQLAGHAVELRGLCSDCRGNDDTDQSTARAMLEYGIKSMRRLRPRDTLMDKLKQEDTYTAFEDDGTPHDH